MRHPFTDNFHTLSTVFVSLPFSFLLNVHCTLYSILSIVIVHVLIVEKRKAKQKKIYLSLFLAKRTTISHYAGRQKICKFSKCTEYLLLSLWWKKIRFTCGFDISDMKHVCNILPGTCKKILFFKCQQINKIWIFWESANCGNCMAIF